MCIVAGDVSDDLAVLETTLQLFKDRFETVFFCPGNHELWVRGASRAMESSGDSLAKLDSVLALCSRLNVLTSPARVGGSTPAWVVPLLSWYHAEWDTEPDILEVELPPPNRVLTDFAACAWPEPLASGGSAAVAAHMDAMNDVLGSSFQRAPGETLITFSHFLPRQELCPEKRFLFYPHLSKVVGSDYLRRRVVDLAPDVHLFGHTHFSWDQTLDGVRYVQCCLAYPSEWEQRSRSLAVDRAKPTAPLLIYDSAGSGTFAPQRSCSWSDHYSRTPRTPADVTLAPWVAPRWKRRLRVAGVTAPTGAAAADRGGRVAGN